MPLTTVACENGDPLRCSVPWRALARLFVTDKPCTRNELELNTTERKRRVRCWGMFVEGRKEMQKKMDGKYRRQKYVAVRETQD